MRYKQESNSIPHDSILHLNVKDTVIWHPQQNVVYHVKNQYGELTIQFKGRTFDHCHFYDVLSGNFSHALTHKAFYSVKNWPFANGESLKSSKFASPLPPLVIVSVTQPNIVKGIKHMILEDNSNDPKRFAEQMAISLHIEVLSDDIRSDNFSLKKICEKSVKNIPVETGGFPIFLEDIYPSFEWLNDAYHQFITYNDKQKLQYQNDKSKDLCMIRAHFLSLLLNQYGVPTLKVVKSWNKDDWKNYDTRNWSFHCAVMTLDKDHNPWIWDPWVGFHPKLLTLNEWLNQNNEPTPTRLLVTSNMIVNDCHFGYGAEAPHFFQIVKEYQMNALQAICGSALPNPPRPQIVQLSQNPNTLFISQRKLNNKQISREGDDIHECETSLRHKGLLIKKPKG